MKALSIGLALAVVVIVVAAVTLLPDSPQEPDSAQEPTLSTPMPTPTLTAQQLALVTRVTVAELVAQIKANPKRYKYGDMLIISGVLETSGFSNNHPVLYLMAPEGWSIYLEFPAKSKVAESVRPGDRVEVQTTVLISEYSKEKGMGEMTAGDASLLKVTKPK